MKSIYYTGKIFSIFIFLHITSCVGDLDTIPLDPDVITSGVVYDDPQSYLAVLAKLYAGLAVSGQQGPAGQADIEGIDEGFGQYLRGYWYHQQLSTDEALIGWNDQTIKDFHNQTWSAEDGFIFAFYSRIFYQISLCNEFLRETTEAKLNGRGVDDNLRNQIQGYRAEARFLRALSYYHALDLFRNVPFVTEEDAVGSFFPEQINATDLFSFLEKELKEIETVIAAPRTNPYARADQGAVWALLAKLYLNAQVYTGAAKYSECLEYCNKIINAGYELEPEYQHLFLSDNHRSKEIIFPVAFDGINTRTWGGMTFIIRAGIGGRMDPNLSGVFSGWGGTRTTRQLVEKFPDLGGKIIEANEGNTVRYPKLYVPGAYQGWNASNTQTSLSSVNSNRIFEGHVYFPDDNSPFLFTTIPSFAITLGDNNMDGTLEMRGDTIRVAEKGLYFFSVDLNTNRYTLEKRTWGIIGDATTAGWDGEDLDLSWNQELGALEINVDLKAGEFKFRANNDNAINLGDNDKNAILTQGGSNIRIESDGSYQILLYIEKADYTYAINLTSFDGRGIFFSDGQTLDIDDVTLFTHGYAIHKFKNVTSAGVRGSDSDFPDTDFPMFRLADIYLMASEAILRGAQGGSRAVALDYFNRVRARAYKSAAGGIKDPDLTLDIILDERARELYWECHRRTDLVRFGQFSNGSYMWAWKGGVKGGQSVPAFRDVYPVPSADLGANPNLKQNSGY